MRLLFTVLTLAALSAFPSAQFAELSDNGFSIERLRRIREMIDSRINAGDVSGAVTFVARRGRTVHFEAHGLMDIESERRLRKDTIFTIASMTKPVTAVAILMLAEEGKLRVTDPVSRFIREFEAMNVAVPEPQPGAGLTAPTLFRTEPAARQITIEDLLTHTSGIVTEGGSISSGEAARAPRQRTETLADYIPRIAAVPLEFQPGERWQYSPAAGFDVLARIVEVVSGQAFDRFLKTRIFDPLGMQDTAFNLSDAQKSRLATSYLRRAGELERQPPRASTVYFSGGGGLMSTVEDYRRFAQMLLNRGQLQGKRLLKPQSVDLMTSVHVPDTVPGRQPGEGWGLGVRVITDATGRYTWLSKGSFGWTGAQSTHFWVDPEEELVAIVMVQTRGTGIPSDFERLVMQAIVED
jgi:CubicO group peptidase (beta-lactamase class C family)